MTEQKLTPATYFFRVVGGIGALQVLNSTENYHMRIILWLLLMLLLCVVFHYDIIYGSSSRKHYQIKNNLYYEIRDDLTLDILLNGIDKTVKEVRQVTSVESYVKT